MKSSSPVNTIHQLERLLVVCTEGTAEYQRAGSLSEDTELRAALTELAEEREEMAGVFAYTLVGLGCKMDHPASLKGLVRRRFLERIEAYPGPPRAVLEECVRSERATLARFDEVLGHELPQDVRTIVLAQYGRLLRARDRLLLLTEEQRAGLPAPLLGARDAGAALGALAGAVVGAVGGPPGVIAGTVLGTIVGEVAASVMDTTEQRADAHDRDLDRTIGVTGGDMGVPREALANFRGPSEG
jgi:uncharacterized protein (TIGR02284 family)